MDSKSLRWFGFLAMILGFGVTQMTKYVDKKEQEILIEEKVEKAVKNHLKNQ